MSFDPLHCLKKRRILPQSPTGYRARFPAKKTPQKFSWSNKAAARA
jgi:hypothetical protein